MSRCACDEAGAEGTLSIAQAAGSAPARLRYANLRGAHASAVEAWLNSSPVLSLANGGAGDLGALSDEVGTRTVAGSRALSREAHGRGSRLARSASEAPTEHAEHAESEGGVSTTEAPWGAWELPDLIGEYERNTSPCWAVTSIPSGSWTSSANSGQGYDRWVGDVLTGPDFCSWVFQGYNLRLLDHPDNEAWWDPIFGAPSSPYTPALGWHAHTASTCTVYIRERCRWRIYFPAKDLLRDSDNQAMTTMADEVRHPADVGESWIVYPGSGVWRNREHGRFNDSRFSWVECPAEDGLFFPVLGPRMIGVPSGDSSEPWSWEPLDWSESGWNPTAVIHDATDSDAGPNSDGVYTGYQDVSVIDLYEEIGLYLMVCVECRSGSEPSAGPGCCVHSCDSCDSGLAYTRIVVFFSESPDFADGEVWPDPNDPDAAAVLLQPDVGAGGPLSGECPNEAYSVPHAVRTPDGGSLLLIVPWQGDSNQDMTRIPERIRSVYADFETYDGVVLPPWTGGAGGTSVFRIDTGTLYHYYTARRTVDWLALAVRASYQGEMVITDASYDRTFGGPTISEADAPAQIAWATDPQLVFLSDSDNGLWVFFDAYHFKGESTSDPDGRDQLMCAKVCGWEDIQNRAIADGRVVPGTELTPDYEEALSANGDFTLFLVPEDCGVLFDMRSLVETDPFDPADDPDYGWGLYGNMVGDPDVSWLPALQRVRVAYATQGEVSVGGTSSNIASPGQVVAWVDLLDDWDQPGGPPRFEVGESRPLGGGSERRQRVRRRTTRCRSCD